MAAKNKKSKTYKVGRDAATGKFIPVKEAQRRKKTAVVQTIKKETIGYDIHSKPLHITSGVSGSEIIKGLKIKQADVKAGKKLVEIKQGKKKKANQKK